MRKPKPIMAVLLLVSLALILVAAGCGGGTKTYGPNETFIIAMDVAIATSLDPGYAYESASVDTTHNLYSNLVTYAKADLTNVVPEVAENWEMSPDTKTWTFHLRHGIKFSSGNQLTSADVVYSLERVVNFKDSSSQWLVTQLGIDPTNFSQVVTAPDPYTVQFKLPAPFAPGAFLSILSYPTTGIVDSKVVKEHVVNGDWGHSWLNDHSAGSGPYILDTWERSAQIVMSANPHYNVGPAPAIKRVIMKHVGENTAQYDMLKKGDVDAAWGLSSEQIKTLKGDTSFRVTQTPELSLTYLGLDVKNVPAFGNPDVRTAIKYAIDYNGIVNDIFSGNAIPNQGIIPKGMYGYDSSLPFSHDVGKAKDLLKKAGYEKGFTVDLLVPTGTVEGGVPSSDMAAKIKNDLAEVGITVNVRQVTSSEMYKAYRAQQAQMILANWGADYPDPDDFAKPFADYTQKSLAWRLQWDDPELTQLVQRAAAIPNGPEREGLYKQINDIEHQRGAFVMLYQPLDSLAMSAKVQNVYNNPLWGIEFTELAKQK